MLWTLLYDDGKAPRPVALEVEGETMKDALERSGVDQERVRACSLTIDMATAAALFAVASGVSVVGGNAIVLAKPGVKPGVKNWQHGGDAGV